MEKWRSPRAAPVVPVDLTLSPLPGEPLGDGVFLAFLVVRGAESGDSGAAVAVVAVVSDADRLAPLLTRLSSVADALLLLFMEDIYTPAPFSTTAI